MKWKYKTRQEIEERLTNWHTWFAWYPAKYNGTTYWMQKVERKKCVLFPATLVSSEWFYWEYRDPQPSKQDTKD